jgi:hypothetical protein
VAQAIHHHSLLEQQRDLHLTRMVWKQTRTGHVACTWDTKLWSQQTTLVTKTWMEYNFFSKPVCLETTIRKHEPDTFWIQSPCSEIQRPLQQTEAWVVHVDGTRQCLKTVATNGLHVMYEHWQAWWNNTDEGNRSIRRKTCPVPLSPVQIPHTLTKARTWVSVVRSQWLTAWAIVRPQEA